MKQFSIEFDDRVNDRLVIRHALAFERRGAALALSIALLLMPSVAVRGESPRPRVQATAPVTAKLLRYAQYVVRHYDADKNGQLEPGEWHSMQGQPERADTNHDGLITVEEYAQYCADYGAGRAIRLSTLPGDLAAHDGSRGSNAPGDDSQATGTAAPADPESGQSAEKQERRRDTKYFASLPSGIPQWFVQRDGDGDGQLTLSEYSPKLLKSEIDDFNRYDSNRDGILTVREFLRAGKDATSKSAAAEPARAATP